MRVAVEAPLIAAVPAPHLPGVLGEAMTPEIRSALGNVTFGPMAVLSIRTDETAPMPWDDLYSVLTPDLRFNMLFMATLGWSMRTVTRSMSVKRYGLRLETASKDS